MHRCEHFPSLPSSFITSHLSLWCAASDAPRNEHVHSYAHHWRRMFRNLIRVGWNTIHLGSGLIKNSIWKWFFVTFDTRYGFRWCVTHRIDTKQYVFEENCYAHILHGQNMSVWCSSALCLFDLDRSTELSLCGNVVLHSCVAQDPTADIHRHVNETDTL